MKQKSTLIGTFVKSSTVPRKIIRQILETFDPEKIFVFNLEEEKDQFLLTFNIQSDDIEDLGDYKNVYRNTIKLHRNSNTNTLYTINGLNKLVESKIGKKDKEFNINWDEYSNKIILTNAEGDVKILSTRVYDLID